MKDNLDEKNAIKILYVPLSQTAQRFDLSIFIRKHLFNGINLL